MATERKRRKFTPEFKKDAVALVTEQGYSIAKAALAVDTNENNLRRWKGAGSPLLSGLLGHWVGQRIATHSLLAQGVVGTA